MSDLDTQNPQFTTSIRGYDRTQVDDYLHRLQSSLAEAEERARAAESELEFSRHTTIGPRVSQIFDLAVAEAKDLRERVEEETTTLLADARQQADQILADGHRAGNELNERTRAEHAALVAQLNAEREQRQAEAVALQQRKTGLLAELRNLHEALGSVAALASDEQPINADGYEVETIPVAELAKPETGSRSQPELQSTG